MSDKNSMKENWLAPLIARCVGMKNSTRAWGGLALAGAILLSLNLIASIGLKNWRSDLTEDSLYTISNGTRETLKSIDEPITAQVYFSKRLAEASPDHARYFERVRALFEQFRDISGGKIVLSFIDPEPFSDAEDKVVAAGLQGVRLNAEGEVGYFGLVARNATDNQEVIPFFVPNREAFLEYDVTKLIYTLANPKKRTIGLMTALPLEGGKSPAREQPTPPWLIMSQIREFFDVRTVEQTVGKIPDGLDVLMVAQPTQLTPQAAYAIDQYALKGGKVLVFIDPSPESAQLQLTEKTGMGRTELAKVLEGWGVAFDGKTVAADIRHARRVQFGGGPGGQGGMVTEFVAWLTLDKTSINPRDVLSAGIETLNMASAGHLTKKAGAAIDVVPIVETSDQASEISADKVGFGADPLSLLRGYAPGGKKLTLAARLTGTAQSAFPNGKPKAEETKDGTDAAATGEKPATEASSTPTTTQEADPDYARSGNINVIVVADTDILADQFWVDRRELMGQNLVMPSAHNAAFVVGALDNLSGNNALIALRGRGVNERPFTYVEALRRDAERQYRSKEQDLEKKLKNAQDELQKLQTAGEGGSVILSEKEREAVDTFKSQMLETRRELREVKRALRRDIDQLDGWLKFTNIALVPIIFVVFGIGWSWQRTRRRDPKKKHGHSEGASQ